MSAQRVWEWIEWSLFAGASGERRMNKTILLAGFACLSMIAVAQSKKTEPAAATEKRGISSPMGGSADRITSPRDIASGQASGRQAAATSSTGSSTAGQANAKGSAHAVENVSAGDHAKASVHASAQAASVQSPKEVSTGKAAGGISAHDDWEAPKAKTAAPVKTTPPSNPQEQRMHKPLPTSN
jgi:hypothetical protein